MTTATPHEVQQALERLALATGRRADWVVEALEVYIDAIERRRITCDVLDAAVKLLCDTWRDALFPSVAAVLIACKEITSSHTQAPRVKSEHCPECAAVPGVGGNGRITVLHEPTCPRYDASVRPVERDGARIDWRAYLGQKAGPC